MQEMAKKQINDKNNMKPTTEQILSAFNELVREGKITTMSKAKRLELGLADDVEKLTQQAKALIPDLTRDLEGIKVSEKNIVQSEKAIVKEKAIAEKADKKERELFRALESAQDKLSTAKRELKGTEERIYNYSNISLNVDFLNKRLELKQKEKLLKQEVV